jgi:hypothetical protein
MHLIALILGLPRTDLRRGINRRPAIHAGETQNNRRNMPVKQIHPAALDFWRSWCKIFLLSLLGPLRILNPAF